MTDKYRARASHQALVVPVEPASRLDPSGFDPSRLSALSFVLPYDDGGERLSVSHDRQSKHWSGQVVIRQYESDDRIIYVELADLHWLIDALKMVAIAMEARSGETEGLDPKDDSAGRNGIAP